MVGCDTMKGWKGRSCMEQDLSMTSSLTFEGLSARLLGVLVSYFHLLPLFLGTIHNDQLIFSEATTHWETLFLNEAKRVGPGWIR